jgi:recombination protein RecR
MAKTGQRATEQQEGPPADSFERLIRELEKLPGIGRRSAERMAYHILGETRDGAMALAYAIRDVKRNLHPCAVCGDLTEREQCSICGDARREAGLICVVEWPRDVRAIEKSGQFAGRYHVLMGRLSPLSGVGPGDLRIAPLLERVKNGLVVELVLATSPTVEGDGTAAFIGQQVKALNAAVRITRLARGVPEGSELSFAQSGTIGEALRGRNELKI